MNKTTLALAVALVAVIIAIGAFFSAKGGKSHVFGAVDTTCQGFTTCLSDLYITTASGGSGAIRAAGTLIVDGASTLTGLVTFNGGEVYAKTNATSTSATAQTLVLADVNGYDTVIITPTSGPVTETLFASSTASAFLPTAGSSQKTCIINGTTTAAQNIILAGGTGTTLLVASSSASAVGSLVIGPQKEGCITFTRGNSTATTFDIISTFTTFK